MESTLTHTYTLSAGEDNAERELSLPVLMSHIIEISTEHANLLEIGNPNMVDIHAGWVLVRLTLEMESYPQGNDPYCITTWVESFNRHFSERSFKIFSPDGKIFGYARTIWMVMDTENHTNVGLTHLKLPEGFEFGSKAPIELQAKHVPIVTELTEEDLAKGSILATSAPTRHVFKYCDLDFYRHVNTVRYVELLLNQFSLKEHDTFFVNRMEISFLHEAKYGVPSELLRSDNTEKNLSSFLLRKEDDKTHLMFARLRLLPR